MSEKVFLQGNEAMAESAIRAGCRMFFGYPITPSSEVPEYYSQQQVLNPERNICFVQAETETAAFNMVAGACATGARAMTATSGPGFSLGQEAMSYMSAADIPAVIVEVMRPGPADGEILASQGDYFQATKGGGHGDYNNLVLAPFSVQEMCDLIQESFDLAEKYRNPVILLSDATLAKMHESVILPDEKESHADLSWALTGCLGRENNVITTCGDGPDQWEVYNKRLQKKYALIKENEQRFDDYFLEDAEYVVVAFGSVARIALSAVKMARSEGIKAGLIRPISLWPFPTTPFEKMETKKILVVELNAGQMVEDVKLSVKNKDMVSFYGRLGGKIPSPAELLEQIRNMR